MYSLSLDVQFTIVSGYVLIIIVGIIQTVKRFTGRGGGVCEDAIAWWCTGQRSERGECSLILSVMNILL